MEKSWQYVAVGLDAVFGRLKNYSKISIPISLACLLS
jgi:hypothetical protein